MISRDMEQVVACLSVPVKQVASIATPASIPTRRVTTLGWSRRARLVEGSPTNIPWPKGPPLLCAAKNRLYLHGCVSSDLPCLDKRRSAAELGLLGPRVFEPLTATPTKGLTAMELTVAPSDKGGLENDGPCHAANRHRPCAGGTDSL